MLNQISSSEKTKFNLELITPYSTFHEGAPERIPFVVDGLLTQGGFSALGAKPKYGKSSLSRYEAVCVAKGAPFLGRETTQGEVILISLEDARNHVDNCLNVLGYDLGSDARISIVEKLPRSVNEAVDLLGDALTKMPNVRLVIVDTLAKLLRVKDLNDYSLVLGAVEQLHHLARKFSQLHIQGLVHCKKMQTDDPFDSLLGSTALRGEPDTNIAIYQESRQRVIVSETRGGRNIRPTILEAELVESAGADVVKEFSLGPLFDEWKAEKTEKRERRQKVNYEDRIVEYLRGCDSYTARQELVLDKVEGKRENLLDTVKHLVDEAVLMVTGIQHSPTNPLTLTLNPEKLSIYRMGNDSLSELAEAVAVSGRETSPLGCAETGGQKQ